MRTNAQRTLAFELPAEPEARARPFGTQLLKWIGNKQRLAPGIIAFFPEKFGTYFEPFLGSGGVLGVLAPKRAQASDCFAPLVEIWQGLKAEPGQLKDWYRSRWETYQSQAKPLGYEHIKASYNASPNGADLLFLSRSCYGGVVRFRMRDGYMSTPCGVHEPISPDSFAKRVDSWVRRVSGTTFSCKDYSEAFLHAQRGDLIYCDPPYSHSQAILYGAQRFELSDLFEHINLARRRGVYVALSIDGTKKSGSVQCEISPPDGLFQREVSVHVGRSMLKRFQMVGKTLDAEVVTDRLLLTY